MSLAPAYAPSGAREPRLNPNARSIAHLEAGGLLLTPDLRQARILRRLHDRAQAAAGRQVWPSAQVLPIEAWLALQWQQAAADRPDLPALLPPVALRWLWWRQAARDAPGLLDPADLGARARASWLRLRAHGGDLAAVARWPLTRDQQAFLGWAGAVEGELAARRACDAGDLARLLVASSALPSTGPPILLAGFRRLTPPRKVSSPRCRRQAARSNDRARRRREAAVSGIARRIRRPSAARCSPGCANAWGRYRTEFMR